MCTLMFFYLQTKETSYQARITFMTNESSGGGASSLLKMANSFGINIGGGSARGLNAEKLAELLVSHRMLTTTLLQEITIDGNKDIFVNHHQKIIKESDNLVTKIKIDSTGNFDLEQLSINERKIINEIITAMRKGPLGVSTSDNGIVRAMYETKSEVYSQKFITALVENLSFFYTDRTVQLQRETNDMLNFRVDSLNQLLLEKEANLRAWLNKYTRRIGAVSLTPDEFLTKSKLEREAEIASNLYKESVQAFEIAKVDLEASRPIIQIIDYPMLPLEPREPVPLIFYGVAVIGALIISTTLIIFWKLIRDALAHENAKKNDY